MAFALEYSLLADVAAEPRAAVGIVGLLCLACCCRALCDGARLDVFSTGFRIVMTMFGHLYWLVFLTFVFSLCLDTLMMPDWVILWWPEWTALTTVFWVFTAPRHFGVFAAWLVGLLSDALHVQPLGQHALAFSVLAYVSYLVHLRVRVFPLWQQCLTVFVLLGIGQMVQHTVAGLVGVVTDSWWYYLPVVSGAGLWPLILPLLRGIRRRWVVEPGRPV